jgi:dipeptidyl aminopeptidase/acylaminoacyl peptidase
LPCCLFPPLLHFPTNEDLRHVRALADPRPSPDGRLVLIRITDSTAEGAKSHLWLVDVAGNEARQLNFSPESDITGESHGEWMPEGKSILFIAHRGEHAQLFRLPMQGGEAKPFDLKVPPPADASKLEDSLPPGKPSVEIKPEPLPLEITAFEIASDGKTIALIANDPKTPGEKKRWPMLRPMRTG